MTPPPPVGSRLPDRLYFACPHCHYNLSVGIEAAGVQGNCPQCGGWIVAPQKPVAFTAASALPASTPSLVPGLDSTRRFKARTGAAPPHRTGRVMADGMVDRTDLDNRELRKILRLLACFILAFSACLAVYWFLKNHQA